MKNSVGDLEDMPEKIFQKVGEKDEEIVNRRENKLGDSDRKSSNQPLGNVFVILRHLLDVETEALVGK